MLSVFENIKKIKHQRNKKNSLEYYIEKFQKLQKQTQATSVCLTIPQTKIFLDEISKYIKINTHWFAKKEEDSDPMVVKQKMLKNYFERS